MSTQQLVTNGYNIKSDVKELLLGFITATKDGLTYQFRSLDRTLTWHLVSAA